MRISTKVNDSGYSLEASKYVVLFNGEILENCHTADEERGIVIVYPKKWLGQTQDVQMAGKVELKKIAIA